MTITKRMQKSRQGFTKVATRSLIKISHSQSLEHAQKTSCDWFQSPTSCKGFLEVTDQSPTSCQSVTNWYPISRQPISSTLWRLIGDQSATDRRLLAHWSPTGWVPTSTKPILPSWHHFTTSVESVYISWCTEVAKNRQQHQSRW